MSLGKGKSNINESLKELDELDKSIPKPEIGDEELEQIDIFPIAYLIKYALTFIEDGDDFKELKLDEDLSPNAPGIGNFVERKFKEYCKKIGVKQTIGKDVDIPKFNTDIKCSSKVESPKHGAEFRRYFQKIYGIGYNIILFTYDLDRENRIIKFRGARFLPSYRTGDHRIRDLIGKSDEDIEWILNDWINQGQLPKEKLEVFKDIIITQIDENNVGYLTLSYSDQWQVGYSKGQLKEMNKNVEEIITELPIKNREYYWKTGEMFKYKSKNK